MSPKEEIDLFLKIKSFDLTPNEYFFLRMVKQKREDLLNFSLEETELSIVQKFGSIKDALNKVYSTTDPAFEELVKKYRDIFPAKLLPSGKQARSTYGEVRDKLKWFKLSHPYTDEQILEATKRYVDRYVDADYLYMQTASFFIYKDDRQKVRRSSLLEECEALDQPDEQKSFGIDA